MPINFIYKICSEITLLKLLSQLPGANELRWHEQWLASSSMSSKVTHASTLLQFLVGFCPEFNPPGHVICQIRQFSDMKCNHLTGSNALGVHTCIPHLMNYGPVFCLLLVVSLECSANHRPGYCGNLPCDWPSKAWAYSKQETENGPWTWSVLCYCRACAASDMGLSASVPLPIVMGIFILLGFQSS